MRLQMESRVVGEVLVVRCRGRIVAVQEAQALHDHVKKALPETPDVVLQLAEIGFIDSSGLGTLVRLVTHARSGGGDLKLCAVQEQILKTLRMTNLEKIFDVHEGEAGAIAATYQRRPVRQANGLPPSRRVVCFDPSADMQAYLRELLRHAGYNALTVSLLPDAQVLIRATRPDLVILGPQVLRGREMDPRGWVEKIAPQVPLIVLDEEFSGGDPGLAGQRLLESIRQLLPQNHA
jgi:anti-sigma B factor antagonist